ncbi:lysophospholipid acyltransferase family protein [Xanthobacter autotrophicus]|uniref:lysophospholipid acyltransferase family protein n=1 Tax=Xanthobacter autotrophicus TaxID=280 RepID=UPI00372B8027
MTPAPGPAAEATRLPLEFGGLDPLGPEQPAVSRFLDRVRAAAVLVPVALVTAVGIPLQWLSLKLSLPSRRRIPVLYHRILLKFIGVRVKVHGAPAADRPLLILANHGSWIDILVIGSLTPLVFVAKSEVARWPLIGLLAKFQRTVFVDRQRRHTTGEVNRTIAERLQDGDPVVLFAEGTSSDGNRVLPFRTALVGAVREAIADGAEVTVQPLAVSYVRLQGLPMGRLHRHIAAWYGDMDLVPHLLEVLRHGSIDVEVSFGEPVRLDEDHDRKSVTRQCEESVRLMFAHALAGRPVATDEGLSPADLDPASPAP